MGLRFQRRIRIFPGVHLNLSKSGIGLSAGVRGLHVGVTSRGQRYASAGLPGTGVSWREYEHPNPARQCDLCAPGHVHVPGWLVLLALVLLVVLAAVSSGTR